MALIPPTPLPNTMRICARSSLQDILHKIQLFLVESLGQERRMHLRWDAILSKLLESIPLIATVVTSVLSILMARATLRYAASADKSLALAREEFEREWAPELHI